MSVVKPMHPCQCPPGDDTVAISLSPDLSALVRLAQVVQEFGAAHALNADLQNRLNLVLDELVTNSVSYALSEITEPELRLRIVLDRGVVVAQLEDNGVAFNPFEEAPEPDTSLELEERPTGGLGVFLVKQLADSSAYERVDNRNRITLQIVIGGKCSEE